MNNNVEINNEYVDPEKLNFEIVERKGVGHPDTLADALAEECSRVYSNYCLKKFGAVLHHNLDKLYIGGGLYQCDYGVQKKVKPINIVTNGRISNQFADTKIDIDKILRGVIKEYIAAVLPHVDVENDLNIVVNSTQNTRIDNWFSPKDRGDIPDSEIVFANDTSAITAYYPLTTSEKLAIEMERFFWNPDKNLYPKPIYNDIGQDIKVMVIRKNNNIDVVMCIPVIATEAESEKRYFEIIDFYEKKLTEHAKSICKKRGYKVNVTVNAKFSKEKMGTKYLLVKGTSAECGEEGLVGRGNNMQGIIPLYRPNSMEAGAGKNPRYHTGRVLSYVANKLAKEIYLQTNSKCSITMITKNKYSLIPPYETIINLEKYVDRKVVLDIVKKTFETKNITQAILQHRNYI